ncbi:hypothetical protein GWI33_008362 [Rhynchophorus ferrugineus]|uniref:Uncharacterized protein n=1 Tax=Rhynchophorus ferrugineus TaxID=354439 RepID=A0A834IXY6_RHYFE|nr:hypothetical protein GWI33_008362 [Rhynchophorus ferrugineus]
MKGVFGFLVICFVVFSVQNYVEASSLPYQVVLCQLLRECQHHCAETAPGTIADCSAKDELQRNYCRCL